MLKCDFSWQAQYVVKFGKIAGARSVVFFNTKCSRRARKVTLVPRRVGLTGSWSDHARIGSRIMLGSVSDHARIGRALWMAFQLFSPNFCQIWGGHFAWQAQYLMTLDSDFCCSEQLIVIIVILFGRHNIWWLRTGTSVAPRDVNDVTYAAMINHECYFVIQSSTGVVPCSTE